MGFFRYFFPFRILNRLFTETKSPAAQDFLYERKGARHSRAPFLYINTNLVREF